MSAKRWFVAFAACAAPALLGTACTDVGVVPEVPEEAAGAAALDGVQASWAGGGLFPDPANDPRCEPVGSKGGVDEYRCETRTTPLTRNDDDVWFVCRYRVRIYSLGGQVTISVELLRCWTSEPDDGGGEEASLTLDCAGGPDDEPVERGARRNCAASLEGGAEDASVVFEWESDYATWTDSSGAGGSDWGGVATDGTDITVTVVISSGENTDTLSETQTVPVTARMWPFQQLHAPPQFAQIRTMGLYDLPATPSIVPSASDGSGPWEGRFYMPSPPKASTALLIHTDYSASGRRYSGARGTCQPPPHSLAARANVYEVNDSTACNRLSAMEAFYAIIVAHEREHEAGINACLSSGTARAALNAIEELVGDSEKEVTDDAQKAWSDFYKNSLNLSGWQASGVAFNSGSYFWYYRFGWYFGTPGIANETGQHSC